MDESKAGIVKIKIVNFRYERTNTQHRKTITECQQHEEKSGQTRAKTVPFQAFNPEIVKFDKQDKGVGELKAEKKNDNSKQNFSFFQKQLQNHQSFDDYNATITLQYEDHDKIRRIV